MIYFKRKRLFDEEWFPTDKTLFYRHEISPMEGDDFKAMKATLDDMVREHRAMFWGMTGRPQEEDRNIGELYKIMKDWENNKAGIAHV